MIGFSPLELGILTLAAGAAAWACRRRLTVRGVLRGVALVVWLTAISIAALVAIFLLGRDSSIAYSIAKSRSIEASFDEGARFVESFRQEHAHLPSRDEFDEWWSAMHKNNHLLWIEAPPQSAEALAKLGPPSADGYLLVCWRGEWAEYFASWSKSSTLVFDPSRYYQFGGPLQDAVAYIALVVAMVIAGALIWRRA